MNCIIVDDELPAIKELSYFISNYSSIKVLGEFDDSIKALEHIQKTSIDIIFLDINMPKLDGLALSRVINTIHPKPLLVFITAYKDYAIEAFEVSAFDYVLKPYSEKRIADTLSRLEKSSASKSTNRLTIWKNEKLYVVNISDIFYCKANEHEVYIYTRSEEYRITSSISELYKRLPQDIFFKCHRSFIVNINKITEIIPWFNNTYMLSLQGIEAEVPVSRQNISQFKQLMGI
jgi:two-component system, LytTR family, response regulator